MRERLDFFGAGTLLLTAVLAVVLAESTVRGQLILVKFQLRPDPLAR